MRVRAILVAALILAPGGAQAEILVGFVGPLTGEMELAGEQMGLGAKLAADELNAAGGVLGQKLILNLIDDHCDAEQALAAARKLVADRVMVAIGHVCSGTAIPASLIYEAARIPLLTLAANPLLTDRGLRYTFRVSPADDTNARFTATYIVRPVSYTHLTLPTILRV